jgi:transcriptional regulator with XRE-family HTH domain
LVKARQKIAEVFYDEQGSVVTRARLMRGWSQKQLADAIGTSQPHIARIESGRDTLLLTTAARLADALGQDRAEFVCQLMPKKSQ